MGYCNFIEVEKSVACFRKRVEQKQAHYFINECLKVWLLIRLVVMPAAVTASLNTLRMAVATRKVEPGLILYSDRGVQYRSSEYQYLLIQEGIQPSMSRKGNCWDNAAMESFFARLKVESIYAEQFNGKQEAYSSVFEYIETFYNTVRRHSANDYKSPNDYEREYYDKCA